MNFKQPLEIYVVWHPDFERGMYFANMLYSLFCRNYENPFENSIGIPVYYRFQKTDSEAPLSIDTSINAKTAVIVFIEEGFVIDEKFHQYLNDLLRKERAEPDKIRVYPIAFNKNFNKIPGEISQKNVIRAYDKALLKSLKQTTEGIIRSGLLHEFARFLLNLTRITDIYNGFAAAPPPIRLFISHSKHDRTVTQAIKFKNYVDSKSQLKSFFDVHDIGYGYDFETEIKKGITESALVVFQSDSYASREWCRVEAITAKSNNCPVIVVNAVEKGEKRSFPYLGNVPTIRLNKNYQSIIDLTLEKVLYNLYQKELMAEVATLYDMDINYKTSTFPELFDIINIKKKMVEEGKLFSIVLYPDPPLGSEELKLLNEMDSNLFFVTPNQLPTLEIFNDGK